MFGREIRDKLSENIFGNFKIFKNQEGDLSPKSSSPNIWLLVNHTKLTNTLLKLMSFNSGELQNNSVKGAILISVNRVIKRLICKNSRQNNLGVDKIAGRCG